MRVKCTIFKEMKRKKQIKSKHSINLISNDILVIEEKYNLRFNSKNNGKGQEALQ